VDYVGFGPVFPTGTKVNPGPAVGLQILAEAARHSVPVVAIGGIRLDRLADLQATGVHAWTAISAVWRSADPLHAIQAFSKPSG
jgi:thiamine-phosphate pyrophosphorylase